MQTQVPELQPQSQEFLPWQTCIARNLADLFLPFPFSVQHTENSHTLTLGFPSALKGPAAFITQTFANNLRSLEINAELKEMPDKSLQIVISASTEQILVPGEIFAKIKATLSPKFQKDIEKRKENFYTFLQKQFNQLICSSTISMNKSKSEPTKITVSGDKLGFAETHLTLLQGICTKYNKDSCQQEIIDGSETEGEICLLEISLDKLADFLLNTSWIEFEKMLIGKKVEMMRLAILGASQQMDKEITPQTKLQFVFNTSTQGAIQLGAPTEQPKAADKVEPSATSPSTPDAAKETQKPSDLALTKETIWGNSIILPDLIAGASESVNAGKPTADKTVIEEKPSKEGKPATATPGKSAKTETVPESKGATPLKAEPAQAKAADNVESSATSPSTADAAKETQKFSAPTPAQATTGISTNPATIFAPKPKSTTEPQNQQENTAPNEPPRTSDSKAQITDIPPATGEQTKEGSKTKAGAPAKKGWFGDYSDSRCTLQ